MREQVCVTVDSKDEIKGPDKLNIVKHNYKDKIMKARNVEYCVIYFHYHDLS